MDMDQDEGLIEQSSRRCCSEQTRKSFLGLLIVIFLAVAWVGAQQFAQSAVTSGSFNAPYLVTWFSTCWMVLCYPIYILFTAIFRNREDFSLAYTSSLKIFGPESIGAKQMFTYVLGFTVLWMLTNCLYVYSLTYIAATDASAVSASNVAFVYALSLILLKEYIFFIRIAASLLCITGVVLFGYADGFGDTNTLFVGIIMALCSAVGAAIYKVSFKRVIYQGTLGQVSLFLTLLGVTNILFLWVIFVILYATGVETLVTSEIPWSYMCGSAALSLVFNFLVNFGIAFTYPLFISIAMMLGIPLNAAVDTIFRDELFSSWRLAAALLVIVGFSLMMCPDTWNLPIHRALCIRTPRCYGYAEEGEEEVTADYSGAILKRETNDDNIMPP
ncbi:solute carrier family 35 member F3 [Ciona intestinalis]